MVWCGELVDKSTRRWNWAGWMAHNDERVEKNNVNHPTVLHVATQHSSTAITPPAKKHQHPSLRTQQSPT